MCLKTCYCRHFCLLRKTKCFNPIKVRLQKFLQKQTRHFEAMDRIIIKLYYSILPWEPWTVHSWIALSSKFLISTHSLSLCLFEVFSTCSIELQTNPEVIYYFFKKISCSPVLVAQWGQVLSFIQRNTEWIWSWQLCSVGASF